MKDKVLLGLVLGTLGVVFAVGVLYATGKHCDHKAMMGAKFEVTNIANGVTVKVISDKPDVVRSIQEHWAKGEEGHEAGKCKHEEGDGHHKAMEGAKFEVSNIDNGVVIKVTSDKPEVVQAVQEHWAKGEGLHKSGNPGHRHKEGSAECKEAHESGKCNHEEGGKHHGSAK